MLPFLSDELLDDSFAARAVSRILGKEDGSDSVLTGFGQSQSESCALTLEKRVRNLYQNAGSVTGLGIRAGRAAVRQVYEYLQSPLDDSVRRPTVDVADETYAACIVLEPGVIQALPRGQARVGHPRFPLGTWRARAPIDPWLSPWDAAVAIPGVGGESNAAKTSDQRRPQRAHRERTRRTEVPDLSANLTEASLAEPAKACQAIRHPDGTAVEDCLR